MPKGGGGVISRRPDKSAHEALNQAFLHVLRRREPDVAWHLVRPIEPPERNSAPSGGQVVRRLTTPQNEGTAVDAEPLPASEKDRVDEAA